MKQAKLNSSMIEEIKKLPTAFLQDLAWLLISGCIHDEKFDSKHTFPLQKQQKEVIEWLKNEQAVPQKNDYHKLPLGKYTEQLLRFYFEKSGDFKLRAFNQQFIDTGLTVGEIDFLIEDLQKAVFVHLELAIKYYLQVERDGEVIFLGPSTKDWFERKIKKLNQHQLKLLENYHRLLPRDLKNEAYQSKVLIKGALFYPWKSWKDQSLEITINGWWIHANEIENLIDTKHYYSLTTDKKEWIFPFRNEVLLPIEEFKNEVEKLFSESRNEVMVVRYDQEKQVIDRGFVVRSNWPN